MQAEQWRTIDITVTTNREYPNPFLDVDVFGVFTGPQGQTLKLLGFWDGEGTWVVRFAPTALGIWSYRIESTDADNGDFSGSGTVECVPYTGELDIYKHGFLKVSADKDYLTYGDGTPFFWLGDTHWTFVTEERFDESNCPKYDSQFKACADKRVQQKFNVYQCNFRDGNVDGFFGRNIDMMQKTEQGYLPNLSIFKENVDKKMKYLADCGFVIAVGYAWGFDMERHEVERYQKFAKYTAARYGAYPVVWTLAGELPGYAGDLEQNTRLWKLVAEECEKWNGYENLQSVHLACARPFPKVYEKEPWFDFAMSQAGHGDEDMGQEMYAEFKEMYAGHPVLESEATYEGATSGEYCSRIIDAKMMRRLAYLIMQSGGCGYTYGCNGVWELQWEAGVGGIGWGDMSWWDGLELPGADQLTIFRDFYESVNWSTLKPLPREQAEVECFFMSPAPNRMQIFFTGDPERRTIVGYLTETSMRTFVLRGLKAGKYRGWWMDPETGVRTELAGEILPEHGEWHFDGNEIWKKRHDYLLVIEAAE